MSGRLDRVEGNARLLCIAAALTCGCASTESPADRGSIEGQRIHPLVATEEDGEPSTPPPEMGPRVPDTTVWFAPVDRATNVDPYSLAVVLRAGADLVEDTILDAVTATVTLVDSEGSIVPITVVDIEHVPDVRPELVYVHVAPDRDLADGWYSLRLDEIPEDLEPLRNAAFDPAATGLGTRFHVGSGPILVSMRWCVTPTRETVLLDLSEHIAELTGSIAFVEGCDIELPDEPPEEPLEGQLSFDCADTREAPSRRITFTAQLRSVSGLPFRFPPDTGLDGTTGVVVRRSDLAPLGDSCAIHYF
jgi:hypothetical protein